MSSSSRVLESTLSQSIVLESKEPKNGLIYRTADKTSDESKSSDIIQVRIFFDTEKKICIEVENKNSETFLLPIKNNEALIQERLNEFTISDNPLNILNITVPTDYEEKPLTISFKDSRPDLPFKWYIAPVAFTEYAPESAEYKLIEAITNNNPLTVADQLAKGVSPDIRNKEGVPLLVLASSYGDLENVKLLVKHHANLELRSTKGAGRLPPLLTACFRIDKPEEKHENKQKAVMTFLIQSGARVDTVANTGKTMLHYLAHQNVDNTADISSLITMGLDPTQVDLFDRRPVAHVVPMENITKNLNLLFRLTIERDLASHLEKLELSRPGNYELHFKPGLWTSQKYYAFEAVANKLKSLQTGGIGLASDTHTSTYFAMTIGEARQVADVPIPKCKEYAIEFITVGTGSRSSILSIKLYDKFVHNASVHAKIKEAFKHLPFKALFEEKKESKSSISSGLGSFKPAPSSSSSSPPKTERNCCGL